MKLDNPFQLFP